ncbi:ankyrin repeat and SAM domain-containing protein 6-like [Arachis ipaensis]|uniref:ankyrin repeat and SAM domain-containing protein 6-like n=1 Tax=Arachis ipaensis TaxID=130454 RepID=UPI000A2B27D4|nr:ankyrin repeat and SAM domain-containing protein 6-like [Arachis ipaensis]
MEDGALAIGMAFPKHANISTDAGVVMGKRIRELSRSFGDRGTSIPSFLKSHSNSSRTCFPEFLLQRQSERLVISSPLLSSPLLLKVQTISPSPSQTPLTADCRPPTASHRLPPSGSLSVGVSSRLLSTSPQSSNPQPLMSPSQTPPTADRRLPRPSAASHLLSGSVSHWWSRAHRRRSSSSPLHRSSAKSPVFAVVSASGDPRTEEEQNIFTWITKVGQR